VEEPPPYDRGGTSIENKAIVPSQMGPADEVCEENHALVQDIGTMDQDPGLGRGTESESSLIEVPLVALQAWEEPLSDDDTYEFVRRADAADRSASHENQHSLPADQGVSQVEVDSVGERTRASATFTENEVNFLKLSKIVLDFRLSSACTDKLLSWMDSCRNTMLPSCAKTFWRSCNRLCAKEQEILTTHAVLSPGIQGYSEAKFFYSNPREAIIRLLLNTRVTFENELLLEFDNAAHMEGKLSEINTGEWWKRKEVEVRMKFGSSTKLLPVILCTDGSRVSTKKSVKPVYLSLGVHKHQRDKAVNLKVSRCFHYFPQVDSCRQQCFRVLTFVDS
jgi:hypothetical protein